MRGVGALKQLAGLHCFCEKSTNVPGVERLNYGGTNNGNVIGHVYFIPWSAAWKLNTTDKRNMYGGDRRLVGGRGVETADSADDEDEVSTDK